MKLRNYLVPIFLLVLFCNSNIAYTQARFGLTIDRDSVQIGEQVLITMVLGLGSNDKVEEINWNLSTFKNISYEQDSIVFDEFADLDIAESGNLATHIEKQILRLKGSDLKLQNNVWKSSMRLIFYSPGVIQFSMPEVKLADGSDVIMSQAPMLLVAIPEGLKRDTTLNIKNDKTVIDVPITIKDYLREIIIGLLLIIAILLLAWFVKKRKPKTMEDVIKIDEVIKLPAHETALNALQLLDQKQLWQKGMIKEYQTELTDIMRIYLSDRYDINAMEMTTNEIANAIKDAKLSESLKNKLIDILTIADLVKFAKGVPDEEMHSKFLKDAVQFVNETKKVDVI